MTRVLNLSRMLMLVAVPLLAAVSLPMTAAASPAHCPMTGVDAVEGAQAPLDEAIFLGHTGSQCDQPTGCGFTPGSTLMQSDGYCAAKCPSACDTPYDAGYYDEETNCCICVAV